MSSDVWRRAACSKFPGLSQSLLPWRLTEGLCNISAIHTAFLALFMSALADVFPWEVCSCSRELCNRLAGMPPLEREGNLAREKEDPEAEMNRTTTRRNGSSSSNTVIYLRVCLIISLRNEITKFGYWQLRVQSSDRHLKESRQIKTQVFIRWVKSHGEEWIW
jgi:hypothetical protein